MDLNVIVIVIVIGREAVSAEEDQWEWGDICRRRWLVLEADLSWFVSVVLGEENLVVVLCVSVILLVKEIFSVSVV